MPDFHTMRGYAILEHGGKLLTPAMEDYLEMIYRQSLASNYIRVNMLARLLNVRPPSATSMVKKLAALGLLKYKKYDIIFLTEKGAGLGSFLLQRHVVIETFFKNIGVHDSLLADTERVEHIISDEALKRMVIFNGYAGAHPELQAQLDSFSSTDK